MISMFPSPSGERAGRYDASNRSQIRRIEMPETGRATANHCAQSSGGSIACKAIRFCGDEMGELCPPIFAARAIASCSPKVKSPLDICGVGALTIRHGPKADFGGRVRRMG